VATLSLPMTGGKFEPYTTGEPIQFPSKAETARFNRIAYAAAHVVTDPLGLRWQIPRKALKDHERRR